MKQLSSFRLASAGSVLAALFVTTPAVADGPPPAGIWVDAQPWTCVRETGPFARHVELACDALGSACQVASDLKQATYRATLSCGEADAWSLDLQKIDGTPVLTLALGGEREQRLRKAALWVAHASVGEPPPKSSRHAAAPPPAAADPEPEAEPATPPAPPPVVAPRPVVEVVAPPPADAVEPTRARDPRWGLTLSGFGAATNAHDASLLVGGRASAAFGLGHGIYLGPTFNYAQSVDGHGTDGLFLGGAALGIGAPFGGRWVGALLEGGAGASIGAGESVDTFPARSMSLRAFHDAAHGPGVAGYARAALVLQAPIDFAVRPNLALAAMHVSDIGGSSAQLAMLELGVAWPGW